MAQMCAPQQQRERPIEAARVPKRVPHAAMGPARAGAGWTAPTAHRAAEGSFARALVKGLPGGTHRVLEGLQGVLTGYSQGLRGAHKGVLEGEPKAVSKGHSRCGKRGTRGVLRGHSRVLKQTLTRRRSGRHGGGRRERWFCTRECSHTNKTRHINAHARRTRAQTRAHARSDGRTRIHADAHR
jgi:hypothetical protein